MAACFLHHHRAFSIMTENEEARGKDLQSWSSPAIAQLITWNKTHCAPLLLGDKMMKHKPRSHHSAVGLEGKEEKRHHMTAEGRDFALCHRNHSISVLPNGPVLGPPLSPHLWSCQSGQKQRDTAGFEKKSLSQQAGTATLLQKVHKCSALHEDYSLQ